MTETVEVTIPVAKIHRMLKNLGFARISKHTANVLTKYLNELTAELGQKAFKYTQAGARSTISEKDMLDAIRDKKPDFEYEIKN